jgi:hypothetical protein
MFKIQWVQQITVSIILLCQTKYSGSNKLLYPSYYYVKQNTVGPTNYCIHHITMSNKIQWVQQITVSIILLCQTKYCVSHLSWIYTSSTIPCWHAVSFLALLALYWYLGRLLFIWFDEISVMRKILIRKCII